LAAAGLLGRPGARPPASAVWKLGWGRRGQIIHEEFGDPTFPNNYPVIDKIPKGIATSIKSIDLNAVSYQKEAILTNRLNKYVTDLREFEGADWGGKLVRKSDIRSRELEVFVPEGSMTEPLRAVIERVRATAKRGSRPVGLVVKEY
jgi:filamentous hemagglutinin